MKILKIKKYLKKMNFLAYAYHLTVSNILLEMPHLCRFDEQNYKSFQIDIAFYTATYIYSKISFKGTYQTMTICRSILLIKG